MLALTGLDSIMTNCDCELDSLVGSDSGLTLGLKNVAKGKVQVSNLPGFNVDRKVAEGVTTLRLRKVSQR